MTTSIEQIPVALPELGRCVVSCNAPYGDGGLGRHFREIVDVLRARDWVAGYYTGRLRPADAPGGIELADERFGFLAKWTPLRFNRGALNHLHGDRHDRRVAAAIAEDGAPRGETFIGFGNQSLHSFAAARRAGIKRLVLVAANSHVLNVQQQHRRALRDYPLDQSWLNDAQRRKTLQEYEQADYIICGSSYTAASMIEHGVDAAKLIRFPFRADPRFVRSTDLQRPPPRHFRVVYCGSITPMKGVPLLIDAFRQLKDDQAKLCLVGATSSRPMRRYMETVLREDRRIRMAAGDPLPVLRDASAYVHPSYEDGFAYAPMEAMGCGVPVIVTEDTGMKECVRPEVDGYIVPTGEWQPILAHLRQLRDRQLIAG